MSADHIKNPFIRHWFDRDAGKTAYTPSMPFDEYKASRGLNASTLKQPTPLEMLHQILGDNELTESRAKAYAFGECVHKATLEPELFEKGGWENWFAFSPTSGLTTKAATAMRESNPGITLVTQEILDDARRCRDAIYRHHHARELLKNADTELSGHAWDEEHGLWRKIRVDIRGGAGSDYLADVKTTTSVDLSDMKRDIFKLGYDLQASIYRDTDKLITGFERPRFVFIFVTKSAPFMARTMELKQDHLEDARIRYLDRIGAFSQAAHDDQWSAYEHEEVIQCPFTKRIA